MALQMPPPKVSYSFLPPPRAAVERTPTLTQGRLEEDCKVGWFQNAPGASLTLRMSQRDK